MAIRKASVSMAKPEHTRDCPKCGHTNDSAGAKTLQVEMRPVLTEAVFAFPDALTSVTRWVGRPVTRKEDARLTTGRGAYLDDISRPRLVHALESPSARRARPPLQARRPRRRGPLDHRPEHRAPHLPQLLLHRGQVGLPHAHVVDPNTHGVVIDDGAHGPAVADRRVGRPAEVNEEARSSEKGCVLAGKKKSLKGGFAFCN